MARSEFAELSPEAVLATIEEAYALSLQGSLVPYPSYVNRVYGLRTDEGEELVAKFYRPGRWSRLAILEEHTFLADCTAAELPVVPPLLATDGATLCTLVDEVGAAHEFALFPKRSGRNFDAEGPGDWERLGSLCARIHLVGQKRVAKERLIGLPRESTTQFLQELWDADVVPGDHEAEFFDLAESMVERISPLFVDIGLQRTHGDLHRGNILDRGVEGLLVFDFDDMLVGPRVQDLWLLLPERADRCQAEIARLLEGYEALLPFDRRELSLIEPLRLMRMIYFLAWCARQRHDAGFRQTFPDWGSKAFWIREIEDLRGQSDVLRSQGV